MTGNGCPQVGSMGVHSESWYDEDGRCDHCGAHRDPDLRHPQRPLSAPPAAEPEPLTDDELDELAEAGFPVWSPPCNPVAIEPRRDHNRQGAGASSAAPPAPVEHR